jgi:biopolymer transport protein ExbD
MKFNRFQPKKARIEIIPMIDTIFFLLVFFMIASLAMTTMKGMPVNLPKSTSSKDRPMVKTVLTLSESGRYYIDKKPVAFDQVYPELKARLAENPKLVVVINCDRKQSWEKGIQLADEAKRAGAQLLTIATEPKKELSAVSNQRSAVSCQLSEKIGI